MELDMSNKSIIIEFYGMPGSGKSTVSHLVADKIRENGTMVHEPTYFVDHMCSSYARKLIKLAGLLRFIIFCPRKYVRLFSLVRKNGYFGIRLFSQLVNISYKIWIYDHKKNGFIIFDEGITQSAISLAQNGYDCLENERILYGLCNDDYIKKIYIKVTCEKALHNLENREIHDSRIEKISSTQEKKKMMEQIENLCEGVSCDFRIYNSSLDEAVANIVNKICVLE